MGISPIAIGGAGGSGTRVIAEILHAQGIYLGDDLNAASDNLWFTLLFKRAALFPDDQHVEAMNQACDLFLKVMTRARSVDTGLTRQEMAQLNQLAAEDRLHHPKQWLKQRVDSMQLAFSGQPREVTRDDQWGWKEPNVHFFVPFLKARIPSLRYIHVVRHGLDMAFSANQNQLALWGERLLGRPVDVNDPSDALSYWCRVHQRVKKYADELKGSVLWFDFDRLCQQPETQLPLLLEFIGAPNGHLTSQKLGITPPPSTGRFRDHDLSVFRREDLDFVQTLGFSID
jgi:hypothetical protein